MPDLAKYAFLAISNHAVLAAAWRFSIGASPHEI